MTDKYLDKAWKKMELNGNYPLYVPKEFKLFDDKITKAIIENGKEALTDISSKILYRCC